MKVTLLAAGLVATVFAQDLSSIPECARTCLTDAISKDGQCQATDSACVCGRIDALTTLATSCVLSACGQDVALNQVLPAVQTFCANVGSGSSASSAVSSAASSAAASTTASSTSASESSASSSGSASPSATESSSASATHSSSHSSSTLHASTTASSGSTATGASASASSSVVTAGAAQYGSVSGLAAFMLGAIAIF
ncbi:hypothetical protein N8I77_010995 [Diaporthe amygdali]|uniref:CFEM domain-containing protein n=1 Tax=Phomopsis amygdali TaxID=1214568 RepID=A0AAD9VXX2_PHOAM|nr:hypothetical protein N8I77_010995 [Diaporthe amygdali]